jgi:Protein of unknown function (DUF3108)
VSQLLRTPIRRIALAIALSALMHILILWLPRITLPHFEQQLPQLQAKLEPLPNIAAPQPRKRQPKPATVPAPLQKSPAPLPASSVEASVAASAPVATATEEQTPVAEPPAASPTAPLPRIPAHAQLSFEVRRGTDGFQLGEVQHRLDIADGRYTIQASTRTTGLASLFKSYSLNQTSNGTASAQGLRPGSFTEEKNDSGNVETLTASFDWDEHLAHFSHGGDSPLSENTQDALSILYQLSQLPLRGEFFRISIGNGKKLENYLLEIVSGETISTALGDLATVHLRKKREPGESGVEIWLGMEYRLLPVKMQYLEPDGTVAATIIITDIRVSDD